MTLPPQYQQYPTQPAAPGRDHTVLFGWLGIIFGLCCCGILGFIFGALSLTNAKRWGNSSLLGWLAIVAGALNIIGQAIANATHSYPWYH